MKFKSDILVFSSTCWVDPTNTFFLGKIWKFYKIDLTKCSKICLITYLILQFAQFPPHGTRHKGPAYPSTHPDKHSPLVSLHVGPADDSVELRQLGLHVEAT